MVKVFRAAVLMALVFGATSAFAATTHYISNSLGSDKNDGLTKTTPWAHLPGMATCTANCASYTPVAGDQFILYGGDTWTASDLPVNFFWNGSGTNCVLPYGTGATSSCIYIGTDHSWYSATACGSSFCRPIFDGQGTYADRVFYLGDQWCVLDDVEVKGIISNDAGNSGVVAFTDQQNIEVKNVYFHGWSHTANATSDLVALFSCNTSADGCANTYVDHCVMDGSDTSKDMGWGVYGGGVTAAFDNYFSYVSGAMVTGFNAFYGNTVVHSVYSFDGNHGNAVFNFGPLSGNYVFIFNNVIAHTTACNGCVNLWFVGNSGETPNAVGYGFNNVMYDLNPSNIVDYTPSSGTGTNYGTYYLFNNTIECGTDATQTYCTYGNSGGGHPFTLYMATNHWITNTTVCGPGTCTDETNDLVQTVSTANGSGYTSSQKYAFSPTSSSSPTVGTGTNHTSWCTTLKSLNADAGAACQSDTVAGVGYDTSNHTVIVPNRATNARSTSSVWDIGAYQFSSLQTQAPQPPTGLLANVQ